MTLRRLPPPLLRDPEIRREAPPARPDDRRVPEGARLPEAPRPAGGARLRRACAANTGRAIGPQGAGYGDRAPRPAPARRDTTTIAVRAPQGAAPGGYGDRGPRPQGASCRRLWRGPRTGAAPQRRLRRPPAASASRRRDRPLFLRRQRRAPAPGAAGARSGPAFAPAQAPVARRPRRALHARVLQDQPLGGSAARARRPAQRAQALAATVTTTARAPLPARPSPAPAASRSGAPVASPSRSPAARDAADRMRSLASVRRAREREREKRKGGGGAAASAVIRERGHPRRHHRGQDLANRMAVRGVDIVKYMMRQGRHADHQRRARRRHRRADRHRIRPPREAGVGIRRGNRLPVRGRREDGTPCPVRPSSPSWVTSTTARRRSSMRCAPRTWPRASTAASPSTSAPIR